jgi:hypothetical protein
MAPEAARRQRRRRSRAVALAGALSLAMPGRAHADPAEEAAATKLFDDGKAALDRGDTATACAKLEESQRLDPAPGTLFFWSRCEEKRGRIAKAWALLRELDDTLPATDRRRGQVKASLAAIAPRIAYVVVTAQGGPAPKDLTLLCDDTPVGGAANLGSPIPVEAGMHRITLRVPGRSDVVKTVAVSSGASAPVALELGAPAAPDGPDARSGGGDASPGPWIVGGVGVAALVVGAVTGGVVVQKKSAYDATRHPCSIGGEEVECTTAAGASARSAIDALGPATTVALVVGGAAVAGAAIWLGVRARGSTAARVGVAPMPAGASIRLEGAW